MPKEIPEDKKKEYNKTYYRNLQKKNELLKWCDSCQKYINRYGWSKHIMTGIHLKKGG